MSDEIKIGRLVRDFQRADITLTRAADAEPMRLSFPASSETEVERWFGTEVLSHDSKAVRMDRIAGGAAPLLFNHNWSDPVGMVTGGRVKEGRLYVDAQLFDTARAAEVAKMIEGGLRNVSIGYEILEMTEDTKKQRYTATEWEPLEVSIVTVPADASVGVGRSAESESKPVRLVRAAGEVSQPAAPAASVRSIAVSDQSNAAAGANAEDLGQQQQQRSLPAQPQGTTGNRALEMETSRRRGIENLCKAGGIDASIRDHWIATGLSVDEISEEYLQILQQRSEKTKTATTLGLSAAETRRFSILNAVRAVVDKNWSNAGFELECSRAIASKLQRTPDPHKFYVPFEVQERPVARRDLTVASASGGGYLVATNNMSFIELMRNRSVAYAMGAMRLSGLVGNVTVPKQTAAATAVWLANESSTATESAQTFGQMALSPKTVGAYTEISRNLMLQASPDAEGIVATDLASVCSLAVDVGALRGAGGSGEPQGIVGTSGVGSVTGTSLAAAGILEFQSDVAAGNLLTDTFGYVTTPAVAALLMARPELPSTGTTRLWQGSMREGSLFGMRAMTSNQMSSATMLAGDFSKVVIAEWGVLEIEVNPYANFQAGIVGIRAMVSIDVGVRYGGAFSYASSIT